MKILVVSDTHGDTKPLKALLDSCAHQVQMTIHLGDCKNDLMDMQNYPNLAKVAIDGNVDFGEESVKVLTLEGRRVLLLHGHKHGVKSGMDRLVYFAKENEADVCLFGHTHFQTMFTQDDILFMNPGSLVEPRGGSQAGYGFLEISAQGVFGELVSL